MYSVFMCARLERPAFATQVFWADWTAAPTAASAQGAIHLDNTSVEVSYTGTGNHAFVQTGTGTNYWGAMHISG